MTANQEPAPVLPRDDFEDFADLRERMADENTHWRDIGPSRAETSALLAELASARSQVAEWVGMSNMHQTFREEAEAELASTRAELAGLSEDYRILLQASAGIEKERDELRARVPEVAPIAEPQGIREGASESPEGRHGVYDSFSLAVFADVILGQWDNNRCRAELHEYVRHMRTMEASLDEGARDRELLNDLECWTVERTEKFSERPLTFEMYRDPDEPHWTCIGEKCGPRHYAVGYGKTLREAIDAARRSDGKATE